VCVGPTRADVMIAAAVANVEEPPQPLPSLTEMREETAVKLEPEEEIRVTDSPHKAEAAEVRPSSTPPLPPSAGSTTTMPPVSSPSLSSSSRLQPASPASYRSPASSPASAASPMASPASSGTAAAPGPPHSLFQPFLPSTSPPSSTVTAQRDVASMAAMGAQGFRPVMSTLPFSIDNILKPTFGQRLLLQSMAAAAAMAAAHQHHRQQQELRHQETGAVKREPVTPPPPSSTSSRPNSTSSNNNNNNQPVDLSKAGDSPKKGSGSISGLSTPSKDGDVPPGMVRGPNGQLWPAWVFCTRYSDRPSSGE